nr:hypothetical protein [Tanacetum cinerariifolium]
MSKGESEKGLVAESFEWDDESASFEDEEVTKKDKISDLKKVIKKWTSSKVTLDQLLSKQVPGNIIQALGGRGRKKDTNSSKEVLFFKAFESPSETIHNIYSDSESGSDNLEPLLYLPKLTGVEPTTKSSDVLTLADLTQNLAVPKET